MTAKLLYQIYLGMTILEAVILILGKMPIFDAITITVGTAGTGGFAIRNDSLASYTAFQKNVVTVFMILFGVNFNFYFFLLMRKMGQAFKMQEVRAYHCIGDWHHYSQYGSTLRQCTAGIPGCGIPGRFDYHDDRLCHGGF